MPSYKLYYFPIRARGEFSRLVFAAAGKEYEDVRIPFDDWPKQKQKMPFGQMPVLEIDGKHMLAQSYAIIRYLAHEFDLAGKNVPEKAQTDMYVGVVEDMFAPVAAYNFEKDDTRKAAALIKFKDETSKQYLTKIDETLGKNSSGYLVGDSLTYADLALLVLQDFFEDVLKNDAADVLAPYANLKKHRQKISALPKIAEWLKKRPTSSV